MDLSTRLPNMTQWEQRSKHLKRRTFAEASPVFPSVWVARALVSLRHQSKMVHFTQTCLFMTRSQCADEISLTDHLESEISRPKHVLTETFGSTGDLLPIEGFCPDYHGHAADHLLASRRFEEMLSSTPSNACLFCPDATADGTKPSCTVTRHRHTSASK